jgi:hypothetical protein
LLVIVVWLYRLLTSKSKYSITLPFVAILGTFISLIPTFIFDLRHQWLNYQGILSLLGSKDSVSRYLFLDRLYHDGYITVENMGKLILTHNSNQFVVWFGLMTILIIVGWSLISPRLKPRSITVVSLLWLITIIISFSFYRLSVPEYYFVIEYPALIYLTSLFVVKVLSQNHYALYGLLIIFISLSLLINYDTINSQQILELKQQVDIQNFIYAFAQTQPIQQIRYDMLPVDSLGMQYLLKDLPTTSTGKIIHLHYPLSNQVFYTTTFSQIGLIIE